MCKDVYYNICIRINAKSSFNEFNNNVSNFFSDTFDDIFKKNIV